MAAAIRNAAMLVSPAPVPDSTWSALKQGCNLRCPWCSNPEGLNFSGGKALDIQKVVQQICSSRMMFFDGGGVTFTGGEATMQFDALKELLTLLKQENIHTCIETNGCHVRLPELFHLVDHLIMDCKHHDPKIHQAVTGAAKLCTIHDYLAMKLSGRTIPVTEATDAASLGLYDGPNHRFDPEALQTAGIDPAILPEVVTDPCLGTGIFGIPVYAALGENQASFLGATGGQTDVLLVNIGTGGQVSVYSPDYIRTQTLETRPFPDGGWLLVGASLCGGRSYALLETFFRDTVKLVTGQEISAYDAMAKAMDAAPDLSGSIKVTTLFQGTRKDPTLRGSIEHIGTDNFTSAHFIYGVMQGMADELYAMYEGYLALGGKPPVSMVGSGNGLRKNPHLCRIFEKTFGVPLILSQNDEEAACGAAIYAAKHCC